MWLSVYSVTPRTSFFFILSLLILSSPGDMTEVDIALKPNIYKKDFYF